MQRTAPLRPIPPFHAMLLIVLGWLVFGFIIAFYAAATLLLLPLLPLFLFGPVCLLTEVHAYAKRAAERAAAEDARTLSGSIGAASEAAE